MKSINRFLLLFCCLLITGQLWAVEHKVTNTSIDPNTEGSLPYILSQLQTDGDIVTFDESLKNQTIEWGNDYQPIQIEKECTIKGDGITLINGYFYLMSSSVIEGFKFESMDVEIDNPGKYSFINCMFNDCKDASAFAVFSFSEDLIDINFEGCLFVFKSDLPKIDLSTGKSTVHFTSCSFYNEKSEKLLFYTNKNPEIETFKLTNCVIVDKNNKISDAPITSGGYNVIKGGLFEGSTTIDSDICDLNMMNPFEISNGILKVIQDGNAYQHLPANTSFSDPNIHLPEKDIEGTNINYSEKTHSGASQLTNTTIIPVESISLNNETAQLTLWRDVKKTITLTATPKPSNANFDNTFLSWKSDNEEIATVENGIVTAITPGKTTITATYNNDKSLTRSCEIEVFEFITVTSKEASGEGSLEAILPSLQDGDIITFSDNLKGQSIQLPTSTDPQKPKNVINKSITIKGNGVILTGGYLTIDKSCMDKVCIENLNFNNSGIYATYYTQPLSLTNCKFDGGFTTTAISAPATASLTAEECLFISGAKKASATDLLWEKEGQAILSYISCSFINTTRESISTHLEGNIIHVNYYGATYNKKTPEITLTNCVMMDNPPRAEGSASPAIIAPVIRSGGKNVIKGLLSVDKTNELNTSKQDVVNASMPNPVIAENGEYKVVEGRSAYNKVEDGIHSGAIQTTTKATEKASSIKLFSPSIILNMGKTLDIEATVYPENAAVEAFVWESSNTNVATVNNGIVTPISAGDVVITAKMGGLQSSINLTINAAAVEEIKLNKDKAKLFIKYPEQLIVTVLPNTAINKAVVWSSSDETIATVDVSGKVTPIQEGKTTITVKAQSDESITAICEVTVNKADYTNGVFLVNEDWYTHHNGTVNYLTPEGDWLYRVVQHENPGRELGATTQFGTIYGDKFYLVSKQEKDPGAKITGSRFAVCNSQTMKIEKEFEKIEFDGTGGDGRSFLGVNEKIGYVGTSNGIYIFDLEKQTFIGKVTGAEGDGQGGGDPENNPNLYSGQVGTMLRIGNRVFANHQKKGLLVINPETNKVETVLDKYHFTAIVQSKDGYLWAGTTKDISGGPSGNRAEKRLLKIDPWTLSITEIPLAIEGPYANWGAWRADAFCASEKENKLYWRNMPTFFGTEIYEYDITTNTIKTIFDLKKYDDGHWRIYETGFRIDPKSNNLYISINGGEPINQGGQYNRTLKLNPETGEITNYELEDYYWFPAMYVFPDNEAPVISGLSEQITMKKQDCTVDLNIMDADNMDASIVKSISNIENKDLIQATITWNQLHIALLKSVGETAKTSDLTLKFNSNGKVVEKIIKVSAANISIVPAESITISKQSASIIVGETLQLTAIVLPENASNKQVTWGSSDESIISVTSDGLIKALKAGTATITVKSASDDLKAECVVDVNEPVVTPPEVVFQLNKQSLTLYANQQELLTTNAESGQPVEWSTSDASVATVNNGQVIARKTGSATITVLNKTTGKSASCDVTVLETEILPDVDVEETAAYIIFPRLTAADYYLVSVYKRANGLQSLAFTLKVGADGSILRSTRSGNGDINIYLPNLEVATEYITVIEAMRETANGKGEVIKVLSSPSFTTGMPTGNESLTTVQKPEVYYHINSLLLKEMEGYTCYIVTLNGQVKEAFEVSSSEEIHRTNLLTGIYLLTGIKDGKKVAFKFRVN